MSPPNARDGRPPLGVDDRPDRANVREQRTSLSLPLRASLALAMREAGTDRRTVYAMAGADADRYAAEVEGYALAMAHLDRLGLRGREPGEVRAVRRLSRRWLPRAS